MTDQFDWKENEHELQRWECTYGQGIGATVRRETNGEAEGCWFWFLTGFNYPWQVKYGYSEYHGHAPFLETAMMRAQKGMALRLKRMRQARRGGESK